MTGERTIPLLPCASIDDVADFYRTLGFEVPHRQTRPNPYLTVERDDIELHFFGVADLDPETSLGTCVLHVPDTEALYEEFAVGMRSAHGKLLISGIPRVTRPRRRKNTGYLSGFTVIDPGGNWIRIFQAPESQPDHPEQPSSALAQGLDSAIVIGESKGDPLQAAKILDSKLNRHGDAAPADRVEAMVYRAELAIILGDSSRASELLARVRDIALDDADQELLTGTLSHATELERNLEHESSQRRRGL